MKQGQGEFMAPAQPISQSNKESNNGLLILAVVGLLIGVGGVAFGLYGMSRSNNDGQQNNDAVSNCVQPLLPIGGEISDSDSIEITDETELIPISKSGISLVPVEGLNFASYTITKDAGTYGIKIHGASENANAQAIPGFAKDAYLGSAVLFSKITYPTAEDLPKASGPILVAETDDWFIGYSHPQALYSANASQATIDWEVETVGLIQNWLIDPAHYILTDSETLTIGNSKIKMELPQLGILNYAVKQHDDYTWSVHFGGATENTRGAQAVPSFALNTAGEGSNEIRVLGAINFFNKSRYSREDIINGGTMGEIIIENDDWLVTYNHPQALQSMEEDQSTQDWEKETVEYLQTWLKDESHYRF